MAIQFSPEIQQLLTERLSVLPDAIRPLIDGNLRTIVSSLKEAHGLSPEQEVVIENEMVLILLAIEPVSALAQNLIDNDFEQAPAQTIARDAIDTLPTDAQNLLTTLEESDAEEAPSSNAPPATHSSVHTNEQVAVQTQPVTQAQTSTTPTTSASETKKPEHEAIRPDTTERAPGSSLTKSRTMGSDVEHIHEESESAVPRYARPLTETPRYD